MSVKIRLRRTGKRNAPYHRIVVTDSRSPRDGRFIENIGVYDPRHKQERVDLERVDYWVAHGAQMSDTVRAIAQRARAGISLGSKRATAATDEVPAAADETPAAVDEAPAAADAAPAEAEPAAAEDDQAAADPEPADDDKE